MKISNEYENNHVADYDGMLGLYDENTSGRKSVETFIHQVFVRAYDADLQHYMPQLMALQDEGHQTLAALGMRNASSDSLFLENYLSQPIERVISKLDGRFVSRDQIVEIGNLASIDRAGLRKLFVALTSYLSGAGAEWVVFTAVPAVQKVFTMLGLNLHTLAAADKLRLPESEHATWGRYYETGPMVVAGRVDEGYKRLSQMLEDEKAFQLNCYLWEYAFNAGCRQRYLQSAQSVQQVAL